jgi:hypothetical protein
MIHMILDIGLRDNSDIIIHNYLTIILITLDIVNQWLHSICYNVISLYDHIIILYYMNNMIKYLDCHYIIWLIIKYWYYLLLLFYIPITNKL